MKKFLVVLIAISLVFSLCACGKKSSSRKNKKDPVGTPLTAEDEEKIQEVVGDIDYVLESMPDLSDLTGMAMMTATTGDVQELRSMQLALSSATSDETEASKSVTFSFDLETYMNMGMMVTDLDCEGFFKITEDALYAEYTSVFMVLEMNVYASGTESYKMTTAINMPFKLYIDAEDVYIYYNDFAISIDSPDITETIYSSEFNFTNRWIDLNEGYVIPDLAEYFEQMFQSTADGLRSSLETLKGFFESNVADKLSNVDGVYTLNKDLVDDYFNAYNSTGGDVSMPSSMGDINGTVKIDVTNPDKTVIVEEINMEMELGEEFEELLGSSSYEMTLTNKYSFYDINNTTIEKPTDVGGWGF